MKIKYAINTKIPKPDVLTGQNTSITNGRKTTLMELCGRAMIPYNITGGFPPVILLQKSGKGHFKVYNEDGIVTYSIDVSQIPAKKDPEFSARVLEIVSYGFLDYYSRECTRGVFGVLPLSKAWVERSCNDRKR
ncbi:MAG: hypothetical protein DDT22_00330 [candidate division WS2 bacterium]|nr:hypothetical protein [Bacillota bacterium]MBT9174669.1 hypothetical protein [Candidatus Lithacetigena glycinireducens]